MRRRVAFVVAALLLATTAPRLGAQAPERASVEGRVVMPVGERETPIPGLMVTVHRVGPDGAGPLDSTRTDASGRYRIAYTRSGSDEAVYFASAVYSGVAYFSSTFRGARARGDDAAIVVFDTSSHPRAFTIQGHHVVVSSPGPDGMRRIVEVFELSNDTTVTIVGRDSLTPVWSTRLPDGATGFQGGQGDVAPSALVARDGRVHLLASFGPGVKQLSYEYDLPERAFPLRFTTESQTVVLEVLLEEAGAQVRGAGLRGQGEATTQGRTFKRFLSPGALAGERVTIDIPSTAIGARARVLTWLAVAIVLAMGIALARALSRRTARPAIASAAAEPESLVAAIAALDARREANDASLTVERYEAERAALKAQLAASLAAPATPT